MIDFLFNLSVIVLVFALVRLAFVYYQIKIKPNRRQALGKQHEQDITEAQMISATLNKLHLQKKEERALQADTVVQAGDDDMTYTIPLPQDVELIETGDCLMLKGTVASLEILCNEFAMMDQLPNGYCVLLGNWRLFVLEDVAQSDPGIRMVAMPPYHWLFMSCKMRESITGYELHPYKYFYEPFTFAKVLNYGIGIEATDMVPDEE